MLNQDIRKYLVPKVHIITDIGNIESIQALMEAIHSQSQGATMQKITIFGGDKGSIPEGWKNQHKIETRTCATKRMLENYLKKDPYCHILYAVDKNLLWGGIKECLKGKNIFPLDPKAFSNMQALASDILARAYACAIEPNPIPDSSIGHALYGVSKRSAFDSSTVANTYHTCQDALLETIALRENPDAVAGDRILSRLKDFLRQSPLDSELEWERAQALFTAYCLMAYVDKDTDACRETLESLCKITGLPFTKFQEKMCRPL